MKASVVAKQAVEALLKRQPLVIHGITNKAVTVLPRFMPRKPLTHLVKTLMK